jgi:transcriptional antiterminator RfaH
MNSPSRWYALHVRPNYEMAVATQLRHLGIEEYFPVQNSTQKSRRSKFSSGSPLFPGYIFLFFDPYAGPKLFSIPGVLRLLGHRGHPEPIEDEEIAMVRSIVSSCLPTEPAPYFQSGNKIRIVCGPLAGVTGTFIRSESNHKLIVSLPLLQRSIAVTVPSNWVTAEPSCNLAPQQSLHSSWPVAHPSFQ